MHGLLTKKGVVFGIIYKPLLFTHTREEKGIYFGFT
jgi:hypothetical protein